ncbi:MAG: PEP-CTERM sorting domain-containing protein [Desulfobulbaceae bacterium]|nr:PEP-CTERM sorting domain-containing protein [Desulfobulbaceae bacterium]
MSFDAFSDFSAVLNPGPNGVWQYGWTESLGGDFHLFTLRTQQFNVDYWYVNSFSSGQPTEPTVIKNGTGVAQYYSDSHGQVLFPSEEFLHLHPGAEGQYSVVRWATPTDGTYRLDTTFKSLRINGQETTTDVHVLYNSSSLFDGYIFGHLDDPLTHLSLPLSLNAGDTIDFVVGVGSDGSYFADSTGLRATIKPVPEPATMLLFGAGIAGLAVSRLRRRGQ